MPIFKTTQVQYFEKYLQCYITQARGVQHSSLIAFVRTVI